jgi:hypothetical protein
VHILVAIVSAENIMQMFVRDETGVLVPISYKMALRWLVHQHAPLVGLCFALLMISIVLLGFFGYHVSLILHNTTTNETFKWQDLRRHIRYKAKQAKLAAKRAANAAKKTADSSTGAAGEVEGTSGVTGGVEELPEQTAESLLPPNSTGGELDGDTRLRAVERMEDLVNLYNNGLFANLREALFPDSTFAATHRRQTAKAATKVQQAEAAAGKQKTTAGAGGGGAARRRGKGRAKKVAEEEEEEDLLERLQRASNKLHST